MAEIILDYKKLSDRIDETAPVVEFEKTVLAEQAIMSEFLSNTPDIKFLTTNQLGLTTRMFCLAYPSETVFYINPMIVYKDGIHAAIQSDLCLPDKKFLIARYDTIEFNYQDIYGRHRALKLTGFMAEQVQQAIDLLDGILLNDLGLELDDDYFNATEEEQKQIIELYFNSINDRLNTLNAIIEDDPDLKKQKEAMDFYKAVAEGKVKLDEPPLSHRKQKLRDKLEKRLKKMGRNFTKKKAKPRKKRK